MAEDGQWANDATWFAWRQVFESEDPKNRVTSVFDDPHAAGRKDTAECVRALAAIGSEDAVLAAEGCRRLLGPLLWRSVRQAVGHSEGGADADFLRHVVDTFDEIDWVQIVETARATLDELNNDSNGG